MRYLAGLGVGGSHCGGIRREGKVKYECDIYNGKDLRMFLEVVKFILPPKSVVYGAGSLGR